MSPQSSEQHKQVHEVVKYFRQSPNESTTSEPEQSSQITTEESIGEDISLSSLTATYTE